MSKTILKITNLTLSIVTPMLASAYTPEFDNEWIIAFLQEINEAVKGAVPILIGIALLVFVWGVVKFMATDEDRTREAGKRQMFWGLVALFVIVSVWGLVALLGVLFGIGRATVETPQSYFDDAPPSSGSVTLPPCPRCCCNRTSPECIGGTYSCSACSLSCN